MNKITKKWGHEDLSVAEKNEVMVCDSKLKASDILYVQSMEN